MDVEDSTNITGISRLVNYDGHTDLKSLEKEIVNDLDEIDSKNEITDVDKYKNQLESLGNSLGISLEDEEEDEDSDTESIGSQREAPYRYENNNLSRRYDSGQINNMYNNVNSYRPQNNTYLHRVTEEQKKQKILKHVLGESVDDRFSIEKEKEEDDKAILLEQIDMLITSLQDEGINISRIPQVDVSSSIREIESVHKILRLKNDRNRYVSFAEEGILAASHTLEWLFDGKKTYMGRRPDLRGWSATVNIKLRRMRYDTSTLVSNMMQERELGSGWRIGFELLPSLFLFSRMKGNQSYNNNNISNEEMNIAMNKIRDMDDN